ncbi:MAG TPA: ABC transporter substrate-binding protein [Acidimicrobiales bacterium]|nr:ABC transporter substrate-binding protein [Acidimicrobiales bacterium]
MGRRGPLYANCPYCRVHLDVLRCPVGVPTMEVNVNEPEPLLRGYLSGAMSRRAFFAKALALGISAPSAAALLAACGTSSGPASAPAPTRARTADLQAIIRMAAGEDQWPVQGTGAKSTTFAYPLNVNVYEPLIYLASDFRLQPGLALSWELIPPSTWRFHLRQGVKFHDGSAMTADDVVWTWGKRQHLGKTLGTVSSTLGPNSVRKVDDFTVDFVPVIPNLRLPEQIVHPEGAIVPNGKNFDSSPPVGSGPFQVVSYTPNQSVTLNRFEQYWGTKPSAHQMAIRFLSDDQTRVQALQSGQVDFVLDIPPQSVATVKNTRGFHVVSAKAGENQLIYIDKKGNKPHDLGAEIAVRQAVSMSIDRNAYVSTAFDGNADPGRLMAPAAILGPYANLVAPVPHDPQKAGQVLDAAGWKMGANGIRTRGGRTLSLDLIGWAAVTPLSFQFLQSEMKQVGIQANIMAAADTPTYNNYYKSGAFDLDLEIPNQNDGNPAFLPVLRMYSKNPGTADFAPGTAFDQLAVTALDATTVGAVQQASAQMQQMLINQDYIVVPVAGVRRLYAMISQVNLSDPHPSQTNQLWTSLVKYTT